MRKRWFILLLTVVLFNSVSLVVCASPNVNDSNLVGISGDQALDGLFPNFTQKDYDSDFHNYAEAKTIVYMDDNAQMRAGTYDTNAVGTVFVEDSENIVSKATISIFNSATGNLVACVETDQSGRFQIIGLPNGIYDWVIEREGYKVAYYKKYGVYELDKTTIFSFYISSFHSIERTSLVDNDDGLLSNTPVNSYLDEMKTEMAVASFSSAPTLSNFTVGVNGIAKSIERYTYLCYVVPSEGVSVSKCTANGMTQAQMKQYYAAQAVSSNTFLEYCAKVYSRHKGSYTVCSSPSCCQKYDPTFTTQEAIGGVGLICYRIGGDWHSNIQVYKSGNTYNYIYGAMFAHCNGKTKTHSTEPALKSVSCSHFTNYTSYSGNGYGFCQEGGAYRAKQGYSWSNILSYYYSSTTSLVCPHP